MFMMNVKLQMSSGPVQAHGYGNKDSRGDLRAIGGNLHPSQKVDRRKNDSNPYIQKNMIG